MTDSRYPALNLVVIRCTDLERSAQFYEALGLRFEKHRHGAGPEHLSAQAGCVVVELYPAKAGYGTAGTRLGFAVKSLNAAVANVRGAHPDAVVTEAAESEWGRRAVVKDPDGHRVELLEATNLRGHRGAGRVHLESTQAGVLDRGDGEGSRGRES